MLMNTDTGAVDHDDVAIESFRNLAQNMIPDTGLSPSHEPVVACGIRTISIRNICPRRACPKPPQDAVDHPRVVNAGHAARPIRQQWLNNIPLEIGEIKPATGHKKPPNQGFSESKTYPYVNPVSECVASPVGMARRSLPSLEMPQEPIEGEEDRQRRETRYSPSSMSTNQLRARNCV